MGGIAGFRLDIFVLIWMISMGMVNYLDSETGIIGYSTPPTRSITEISKMSGISVDNETNSANAFADPEGLPDIISQITDFFASTFLYTFKAFYFLVDTLWNSTIGLHYFLNDRFAIPMIWALPLMILVNLINFLGLIELWVEIKV